MGKGVTDDHEVDVARRGVLAPRNRAEDECRGHSDGERAQGRPDGIDDAHCLHDDTAQLREDRRGGIGAVALLIADLGDGEDACLCEARKLPVDSAGPRSHVTDDLGGRVVSTGLAKHERQNPLLDGGKERSGKTGERNIRPTHIGIIYTQYGYGQMPSRRRGSHGLWRLWPYPALTASMRFRMAVAPSASSAPNSMVQRHSAPGGSMSTLPFAFSAV